MNWNELAWQSYAVPYLLLHNNVVLFYDTIFDEWMNDRQPDHVVDIVNDHYGHVGCRLFDEHK